MHNEAYKTGQTDQQIDKQAKSIMCHIVWR